MPRSTDAPPSSTLVEFLGNADLAGVRRFVRVPSADVLGGIQASIAALEIAQTAGSIVFDTKAEMDAALAYPPNTHAEVFNDTFATTTVRARTSNVTTLTTAVAHGLVTGNEVNVRNVGGIGYNGRRTVTSAPTANTFTYADLEVNEGSTVDTGGTVDRNGVYQKEGASGVGSWDMISDLAITRVAADLDIAEAAIVVVEATLAPGFIKRDGTVPFTANQSLGGFKLTSLAAPVNAGDAVNKTYFDTNAINKAGLVAFTANQSLGGFKLTNVADPEFVQDATTKGYVDTNFSLQSFVNAKTVGVGGLATGGGTLGSNPVITVPAASNAEALAGTIITKAMTPASALAARQNDADILSAAAAGLFNAVPSPQYPIVSIRLSKMLRIVRTPLVNGNFGDYVETMLIDFSATPGVTGAILGLNSFAAVDYGGRRLFTDAFTSGGSVFEFAFNIKLISEGSGAYGFYGGGHGNVNYNGCSIKIDGGAELIADSVGTIRRGTSLVVAQEQTIRLPSNNATEVGLVDTTTTFDATGVGVLHIHTITLGGVTNQNSYSAMMPTTGCNRIKFGANAPLTIRTGSGAQSANQGQVALIQAWDTDRVDLIMEASLPTGNPGSPDGWTQDTTSDTFVIDNTNGNSKAYINYRSGAGDVTATSSTHQTKYRIRKGAVI